MELPRLPCTDALGHARVWRATWMHTSVLSEPGPVESLFWLWFTFFTYNTIKPAAAVPPGARKYSLLIAGSARSPAKNFPCSPAKKL